MHRTSKGARGFGGVVWLALAATLAALGAVATGCEAEVSGTGTAVTPTSVELRTATTPEGAAGSGAPAPGPVSAAAAATAAAETGGSAVAPGGVEKYGAPLSTAAAVDLDAVVAAPDKFAAGVHKITATVETVCKKKGCWMTLVGASGKADPAVRVTFKDYGFFMPRDCEGAKVTLEGVVSLTEESAETAKHYAEDEGKDPAAIKGPLKKIAIEAAGVELVRAPKS